MKFLRLIDSIHHHIEKYYQGQGKSDRKELDLHNVITVSARVADEFIHCSPDLKGIEHQHFYIYIEEILEGDATLVDNTTVFVAVHYGDPDGIAAPVPNLVPGQPIVARGKFVPARQAYKTQDNPGYPVLHFTHHPIGYIIYDGVKYEKLSAETG